VRFKLLTAERERQSSAFFAIDTISALEFTRFQHGGERSVCERNPSRGAAGSQQLYASILRIVKIFLLVFFYPKLSVAPV